MIQHRRSLGEAAAVQPAPQPANEPYQEAGKYVFVITLAAQGSAGDHFTDLAQFIDRDSDFVLTDLASISTGNYSLNIKTPGGRFMFSSQAQAANVVGTGQFPVPINPALRYVGGGKIGLSLANLTNSSNTIELVFSGMKIYPTAM